PRNATFVFLGAMALAGIAALPMFLRVRSLFIIAAYAAFALAVVFGWYQTLGRFITEITVRLDKTVEFKSALRRSILLPHEITAVRTFDTDDDGTRTLIEHRRGKIDISHIHDIDAVVTLLKAQNAKIRRIDERVKAAPGPIPTRS
ncbi:MAG: hypothetical protein ACRDH5_14350, partial [bacterium]